MRVDAEYLPNASQVLAYLGGYILKPHSPKHEWNLPWLQPESASAVMEK